MEGIGGYFELANYEEGVFPHQGGLLLNTGRNALEYILRSIGDVKVVFLPFYTCGVVLEPLKKLNIPWKFYHIDTHFEITDDIHLNRGEYLIANNYFGIKDSYIQALADRFGDQIIVDNAQAFLMPCIPGIKALYSPRKFVGVADGGVAYLSNSAADSIIIREIDNSTDHNSHLLKRKLLGAEAGFSDFQKNERKLDNNPIRLMSDITRSILNHIDYDRLIYQRRRNFSILHEALADENCLDLPALSSFSCPMVYPFVSKRERDLRKDLIDKKVYVAKYWPDIQQRKSYDIEYDLATRIIPLPCDQRYGEKEMASIIEIVRMNQ